MSVKYLLSLLLLFPLSYVIPFVAVETFHFFLYCTVIEQVTTYKTPDCVDSGTYVELLSSQNMRTQLKFKQNMGT